MGFLLRRLDDHRRVRIHRHIINAGTLRTERPINHRRTIIPSAGSRQPGKCVAQPLPDSGPTRELPDDIAVAVNRDFVEGAEDSFESGKGMVHLLYVHIFHAQIENDGGREGKRIAGKEIQRLLLPVFAYGEILGKQSTDQVTRFVLHRHGNHDLVHVGYNLE